MKKRSVWAIPIVCAVVMSGATALSLAHSGATGVVKERMMAMENIADQMKRIDAMVRGKTGYDATTAVAAADAIARHAAEMPELFPTDSLDPPTEAHPDIWRDWEAFQAEANALSTLATGLATAAAASTGVEAIGAPFAKLASSCKSCHERFRVKK